MLNIAKRSLILLFPSLITLKTVHAQSGFISVSASANATAAAQAADGDTSTGWSPNDNTQDQYLLLALQTPGNVDRIEIDADGISPANLKKLLSVYITYDPMNPGNAVAFTVTKNTPYILSFPAKYGAHVKLLFRANTNPQPYSIKEQFAGQESVKLVRRKKV